MTTKVQTINNAYQQLRISGLTVSPSSADLTLGLSTLENMMDELLAMWNLNIGYNFEVTPTLNGLTLVPRAFQYMMDTNLATRLIPPFGKDTPAKLETMASQSLSNAIGKVAALNLRPVQPPRRMPIGSGNTYRGVFWNRYSVPVPVPPVSGSTNYMLQGETLDYVEDFSAWLGAATISSYEIECDPLLTIDASASATPLITYTLTAPAQIPANYGPYQLVKITVTDNGGRTLIRLINFGVATPPTVPQN